MIRKGMVPVRIDREQPLRKVYVERASPFHNPHSSPLELYVPAIDQLELPQGFSYTVVGDSLYCDGIPRMIGLPRSIGIEIGVSLPVYGVLSSPADISGTGGDVNLVIPKNGFTLLPRTTSGNIVIDGRSRGKSESARRDESLWNILQRKKLELRREAADPQLVIAADGVSVRFDERQLKEMDELDACLENRLIAISRTSGDITLYRRDFNNHGYEKAGAKVIPLHAKGYFNR
ncbi:hypothetical protein HY495_01325 [Candidatus Woesearchaeota archaeon]|nr:hypothetical protein [Candidatus Woesearchaeota archaeon]